MAKKFCSRSCSATYNNKLRGIIYSDEDLRKAVKNSFSVAETLRTLGLSVSSDKYPKIRRKIKHLNLDISHFLGKSHCSRRISLYRKKPKDYLILWDKNKPKVIPTDKIKKWLFRDNIKKEKCEKCGRVTWQGEKIPLSLHHIDGNKRNNRLDNLMILCYNCHGLTSNYGGKGNKKTNNKRA